MIGSVTVGFKLLQKKIGKMDVAGLSNFAVYPQETGRKAIQFIESVADPLPVVGFVEKDLISFYQDCNWYIGRLIAGKFIVASEPIDDSKFTGDIW